MATLKLIVTDNKYTHFYNYNHNVYLTYNYYNSVRTYNTSSSLIVGYQHYWLSLMICLVSWQTLAQPRNSQHPCFDTMFHRVDDMLC